MKKGFCAIRAGVLALCLAAGSSHANVITGTTRVIFPAKDGEATVRLTNENTHPALVEAWIDSGDPHSTPSKIEAPFLITPPLFRMEAHKDQSLRIIAASPNLPGDRESVFYLNVLDIPPKPSAEESKDHNYLQFSIRTRLKLFYRPADLPGDPLKAPGEITWKVVPDGHGYALEAHNPTPYYVTIAQASFTVNGQAYKVDTDMVDPRGSMRFPVKDLASVPAPSTPITYDAINDYGALAPFKGVITP